jgi:CheY-like chemotaxis protein
MGGGPTWMRASTNGEVLKRPYEMYKVYFAGRSMKISKTSSQSTEFVDKLYKMLDDAENSGVIQWNPSGTSFVITNPTEFGKTVLNRHFKHGNLSSFVRQLNKYDFHKMKSGEAILKMHGPQVWEFRHCCFQRGRVDMLRHITRKKTNADKRFKISRELTSDSLETSNRIQSQIIGTLKMLTVHFQVLVEEVNELKRSLNKKETLFRESVNVFVGEDNVTCSSYAGAILRKVGCNVATGENEKEILDRISEEKYDVIFLSSQLPNINKILAGFRQYDDVTPVVVTVEGILEEDCMVFLSMGASDVLLKPYHQDAMVQMMLKYCYAPSRGGMGHAPQKKGITGHSAW